MLKVKTQRDSIVCPDIPNYSRELTDYECILREAEGEFDKALSMIEMAVDRGLDNVPFNAVQALNRVAKLLVALVNNDVEKDPTMNEVWILHLLNKIKVKPHLSKWEQDKATQTAAEKLVADYALTREQEFDPEV